VTNTQNQAASGTQAAALGSVSGTALPASALRGAFAAAPAAAPSQSLGALPPAAAAPASDSGATQEAYQPAGGLVSLKLKAGCGGAGPLQALAHVRDGTSGQWRTLGFYELKPGGDTVDVGSTDNLVMYVYAQEKDKACGGGARCWNGDDGPWGPAGQEGRYKFKRVDIPSGWNSYTYTFGC
jgi:hypothetical protein